MQGQSSELKLGTGDRAVVTSTKTSDELAHEMLALARKKAEDMAPGSEVTVEVTQAYPHIHHMELMVSFVYLAPQYGLRAGVQFNNHQTFYKV